ncbi:MAG: isoprenyl transferase [Azospirillaceae bacterium]
MSHLGPIDPDREHDGGRDGIPRHVAIIMDGNGRWATRRGMPRIAGHKQGVEAVRRTIEAAADLGVDYLTVFGFSSENWKRSEAEISYLMRLLRGYLRSKMAEMHANGIRLRFIGDRSRLSGQTVELIEHAESLEPRETRLHLTVAWNYGGRDEIVEATRRIAERVRQGTLEPAAIGEETIGDALLTAGTPDPDLLIRTSGERRISNFLLWQCAYAEFYFTDTLWPDFGRPDLEAAISDYGRRERRYGAVVAEA